jgi:hypothetical protein
MAIIITIFLTSGDWSQTFFDISNYLFLFFFLVKFPQLMVTHLKPNIELWRWFLFLFFSHLWWLKPTFSRFKKIIVSLFGVISSADSYTLKTQYRNLAIVSIFSQLWRLKPTVSRFKFFLFHFLAKFLQLMVTHWKPNIEIWRFFPFFFSLVAIETRNFRIF